MSSPPAYPRESPALLGDWTANQEPRLAPSLFARVAPSIEEGTPLAIE